jgi:hypothetical protein
MRDTTATRMHFDLPTDHRRAEFADTLSDARPRVELAPRLGSTARTGKCEKPTDVDFLERLFADFESRRQGRADLERDFAVRVRRTFMLINESRLMCVAGSVTPRRGVVAHAALLEAVIDDAQACFDLASKIGAQDAQGHADNQHCLRDLRAVSYALRIGEPPPSRELAHAMDGLIVLFVQLLPCGAMRFEVGSGGASPEFNGDSRAFAWP